MRRGEMCLVFFGGNHGNETVEANAEPFSFLLFRYLGTFNLVENNTRFTQLDIKPDVILPADQSCEDCRRKRKDCIVAAKDFDVITKNVS